MHGVRRRILELLKERSSATVAELAEWLGMAPVSVRHHLDILQGDNLIHVERLERRGSVGRPQQVYALTREAASYFPNNFAMLAASLVRQIKTILPADQVETVFQALAQELAAEFGAGGPEQAEEKPEGTLAGRVQAVAEFLNAHGYLATCEVEGDGEGSLLLHKHNCPYAGIPGEHEELCRMDQALVDTLLGGPCERVAHMGAEGSCCTYRVRAGAGEESAEDASTPLLFESVRTPIHLLA